MTHQSRNVLITKEKGTGDTVTSWVCPTASDADGCQESCPHWRSNRSQKSPPTGCDASAGFHFKRPLMTLKNKISPTRDFLFPSCDNNSQPTSRYPWQQSRDPSVWNHRVTRVSPLCFKGPLCNIWLAFGCFFFYIGKNLTYCNKTNLFFQPLERL